MQIRIQIKFITEITPHKMARMKISASFPQEMDTHAVRLPPSVKDRPKQIETDRDSHTVTDRDRHTETDRQRQTYRNRQRQYIQRQTDRQRQPYRQRQT